MSINNVSAVRTDITEMLSKLREVSNKSKLFSPTTSPINVGTGVTNANNFTDAMSAAKDILGNINSLQSESEKIKTAYVSGDKSVSMSQVVLASQKSKLAFEGLVTVRNKILEAYKDIMNMPI